MQSHGLNKATGTPEPIWSRAKALLFAFGELFPGARNVESANESYIDTRRVSKRTIITAAGPTAIGGSIGANDVHLRAIFVQQALVGTVTIAGFQDQAGAAQNIVLPVGFVGRYDMDDSINDKGQLTVTLSSSTDYTTNKSVSILWRYA